MEKDFFCLPKNIYHFHSSSVPLGSHSAIHFSYLLASGGRACFYLNERWTGDGTRVGEHVGYVTPHVEDIRVPGAVTDGEDDHEEDKVDQDLHHEVLHGHLLLPTFLRLGQFPWGETRPHRHLRLALAARWGRTQGTLRGTCRVVDEKKGTEANRKGS